MSRKETKERVAADGGARGGHPLVWTEGFGERAALSNQPERPSNSPTLGPAPHS